MAISNMDGLVGAARQKVMLCKTSSATTVANQWHTLFDRAGYPGAGSLSVGNTANGVVPTDATTGTPTINAFGASAAGYLAAVEFSNTVASRLYLYDRLFHVGSIAATSATTTTLASQPSFSSRIPGGTDYTGLEIWVEINTAFTTGATTITVTYTNQSGTTGRTTGASASMANVATGRMFQMPLQAGDTGVQKIETVVVTTANSAGSFNVIIARPLWQGRVKVANDGDTHGFDRTGLPAVYADSALALMIAPDSTSSGVPDLMIDIVNG